jgi:tetratricopeptide (TPR) repeat protein
MPNNRQLLHALLDAHKGSRSGILRVQGASAKKQLILRQGRLAFAESNLPEEHLARILVQRGLLPRTALSEIAERMKAGKTSEEAILAVSGSDRRMLEQGRREQAVGILASLLRWNNCDVRFYRGDNLARYQLDLGIALPEVLVLSARRSASSCVASIPPGFFHGLFFVPQDNGLEAQYLPLDPSESHAYSLVRGNVRIADLLALVPAGDTKPEELFLRLFMLGLIERQTPAAARSGRDSPAGEESGPTPVYFEEMLTRLEGAGAYEILGIKTDASQEEVQSAYHNLAKQFHPDRFQSSEFSADVRGKAERILSAINESYATLKDPGSRSIYDEKRLREGSPLKTRAAAASEQERMADALFREGRDCLARGDFEKAVEHLKGSVWLCPDKADYHRYLGVAQSELPKYRKTAEQHLLKSLELDYTSMESRLELVKLYLKASLPRKAGMQLQDVLRWDPQNPEAHRLSAELEQLDKALSSQR